jgi:hypothetical protein
MIGCEEDDKLPPTLEGLINRYNRWVSTKRLHTKTLGSFVAQEATQATLAIAEPKPKSTHRKQCVCSLPHDIWRCYTLNETAEGRPEGCRPSSKAVRNCQNAFKNADRLKGVKKLFKDKNIPWTFCNDAGKTRDPNLAWSHSEAYGSAWENRNLGSIDAYRSCTKELQKTAYLHLGDCNVKYTKAMKC